MVIIDRPKLWQHRQKQQQHGNNVDQKKWSQCWSVGWFKYIYTYTE